MSTTAKLVIVVCAAVNLIATLMWRRVARQQREAAERRKRES